MKGYGYMRDDIRTPLDAGVVMQKINKVLKLSPETVNVNNNTGEITINFAEELGKGQKEKLDEWVKKYFKKFEETKTTKEEEE